MNPLESLLGVAAKGLGAINAPNLGIIAGLNGGNATRDIHPGALQGNSIWNRGAVDTRLKQVDPAQWKAMQQAPKSTGDIPTMGNAYSAQASAGPTPQQLAFFQAQEQLLGSEIGRLGSQANIGRANIMDSYNAGRSKLSNNRAQTMRTYDEQEKLTSEDNTTAKATIDNGVRNQLTGLQRLLGAQGAGSGSAANVLAPYAAGRMGQVQRGQVSQIFDRNMRSLKTGRTDAENQFNDAFGELDAQRDNQLRGLDSSIASTRANLLAKRQQLQGSIGRNPDPALTAEIARLGTQIDQLGRQTVFQPKDVSVKGPDLQGYEYEKMAGPQAGVDPALAEQTGAYWTLLGGDKKKLNGIGV